MTEYTEQQIAEFNALADLKAALPEVIRDLIRVVEYSVSQKTPIGQVAASLERLRAVAEKLDNHKRRTP